MNRRTLYRSFIVILLSMVITTGISAKKDVDYVKKALEDTTFTWRSAEAKGVRIYYQLDSFAEKHRAMLFRSVTTAVDEALECLGESGYERTLHVFYLESRKEMDRIVGRTYSGFANWTASGVFVVFNPEWRSFEKHEITHVLTMELWGTPDATSNWMIEGIAVYCDGWCREYSVDEIAFHYLSRGQLPPLRELFDNFATLGEIRAGFYAASLIGFIRHTYGAEALRSLWHNSNGALTELLGVDVDKLETSWKNYLKSNVKKGTTVDLETIKDKGCG
ncbi:MAG: hypothetical protein JSV33_05800 [bacterium]|nr:MAG: hypothetical protein JSV33_05800 [bacterium]